MTPRPTTATCLISRELLPKSPTLANSRGINLFLSPCLSIPMRMDDALRWAEDDQVGVGRKPQMRSKMTLPAILRLPPDYRRIAIVPLGGGAVGFSVVAATNKTAEDLEMIEMIQNVQRVMGASKAWFPAILGPPPPTLIPANSLGMIMKDELYAVGYLQNDIVIVNLRASRVDSLPPIRYGLFMYPLLTPQRHRFQQFSLA
ncbi:hypothetical protein M378DRAFT_23366 [Amanita muscaria Koide BX008]|uniref:Uncharacterized protein n=1 Tax=Amanita muscaria (strain Koide BX008) TaxID=946122 RepID=A0A0C2WX58_AMAMK|nr:hypothetical protein M378DRAFT_23366 [Amanita muscaria Koide BX008]